MSKRLLHKIMPCNMAKINQIVAYFILVGSSFQGLSIDIIFILKVKVLGKLSNIND